MEIKERVETIYSSHNACLENRPKIVWLHKGREIIRFQGVGRTGLEILLEAVRSQFEKVQKVQEGGPFKIYAYKDENGKITREEICNIFEPLSNDSLAVSIELYGSSWDLVVWLSRLLLN